MKSRIPIGLTLAALCVIWPNLLLLYFKGNGIDWQGRSALMLLALAGCALTLALLGRPRACWWVNLPWVLLAPVFAGFLIAYREPPQSGMWAELLGTNLSESREQSGANLALVYAGVAFYVAYLLAWRLLAAPSFRLTGRSRIGLAATALVVIVSCYGAISLPWTYPNLRYFRPISHDLFFGTFPTGTALVGLNFALHRPGQMVASMPHVVVADRPERQIFVLLVGETVQYFRWADVAQDIHSSLLRSPDTVVFRNNVSQAPLTMWSVPLLLSGDARESDGNPSWIDWAKAAGFKTVWLNANNFDDSRWEARADVVEDVAQKTFSREKYDADLLPRLDALLAAPDKRLCIVIHVMGGHMSYLDRYTSADARYPVNTAAYRDPSSADYHAATRAAYANAMVKDLGLVEAVEERLRAQQGSYAFMVYAPDHGENLFDDGTGVLQHGRDNPSIYELRVPIVLWGSPLFRQQQAKEWQQLSENVDRPTSSRQVLPTLLWAMGIRGSYTGAMGLQKAMPSGEPQRFVATSFERTVTLEEILRLKPDASLCCAKDN